MRHLLLLAALLCATASIGARPASAAADPFNMKGTWTGKAQAVSVGANPYRAGGPGVHFPTETLDFTFVFDHQEGNRFSGTSHAGTRSETLIGAILPTENEGVFLDDDGEYTFKVRSANLMDLCYRHAHPSTKVVACYTVTRNS